MEIVVPPTLVKNLIRNENSDKNKYILMWLDKRWNLIISGLPVSYEHVNGIVLEKQLYRHGGSWEFSIPNDVGKAMIAKRNMKSIKQIKISSNALGHLIYSPL